MTPEERKRLLQALDEELTLEEAQALHERVVERHPFLLRGGPEPEGVSYADADVWCSPQPTTEEPVTLEAAKAHLSNGGGAEWTEETHLLVEQLKKNWEENACLLSYALDEVQVSVALIRKPLARLAWSDVFVRPVPVERTAFVPRTYHNGHVWPVLGLGENVFAEVLGKEVDEVERAEEQHPAGAERLLQKLRDAGL